jgi:hypothetical protein
MAFAPKFVDTVHEIRLQIARAHGEARGRPPAAGATP